MSCEVTEDSLNDSCVSNRRIEFSLGAIRSVNTDLKKYLAESVEPNFVIHSADSVEFLTLLAVGSVRSD